MKACPVRRIVLRSGAARRWCTRARESSEEGGDVVLHAPHILPPRATAMQPQRWEGSRPQHCVSQQLVAPPAIVEAPPPAWVDPADAAVLRVDKRRVIRRMRPPPQFERDFDAEHSSDDPAKHQEKLLREVLDGETYVGTAGEQDAFHVHTGREGMRVKQLRECNRALRDHFRSVAESAAPPDDVDRCTRELIRATRGLQVARAEFLAEGPTAALAGVIKNQDNCARYHRMWTMFEEAFATGDYWDAMHHLNRLAMFLPDWWIANDAAKWYGEDTLIPGMTFKQLEARVDFRIGECWVHLDQPEQASRLLRNAAAMYRPAVDAESPFRVRCEQVWCLTYLARMELQLHLYEPCLRTCEEVLQLDPDDAEAYLNMSQAFESLGKVPESMEARRMYEDVFEKDANDRRVSLVFNTATNQMEPRSVHKDEPLEYVLDNTDPLPLHLALKEKALQRLRQQYIVREVTPGKHPSPHTVKG
ncbi:hypothetical protein DIPPA_02333 [Diplonema papillatum]|nr:hypothetical protein DIPPA_02333 [Diplonema papillatum]